MKKAIARDDYAKNASNNIKPKTSTYSPDKASDESSDKPIKKKRLKSKSNDPFIDKALNEAVEALEKLKNPIQLDRNDPDYQKKKAKFDELMIKKNHTIVDEYNRMRKEDDLSKWENKRIPRPYDEEK